MATMSPVTGMGRRLHRESPPARPRRIPPSRAFLGAPDVPPPPPAPGAPAASYETSVYSRLERSSFRLRRRQAAGLASAALALACLWYLDALTTVWALQRGAVEGGPVMRLVVDHGPAMLLALKGAGLALIVGLGWTQLAWGRDRLAAWSLGTVGSLSLVVVMWNLFSVLLLAGVV